MEMDSTAIYVTSSTHTAFDTVEYFSTPRTSDLADWEWRSISSALLARATVAPAGPYDARQQLPDKINMRSFFAAHGLFRNDCINVYDFARTPAREHDGASTIDPH